MKYATGNDFGGELCKALGLENVSHLKVEVDVQGVAEVEVTYFMLEEHGEGMVDVVQRYALVPHPGDAEPAEPRLVQEEVPDV